MGVITPAVVYKVSGGVHDMPENTTKVVDDYVVPRAGLVSKRRRPIGRIGVLST